jgi:phosphonate transport system permease protein
MTAVPARLERSSALRFALIVAAAALVLAMMVPVTPSPQRLVDGVPRMGSLLDRMWPIETDPAFLARMGRRLIETMQIALAGTVLGILLSLPIAWCAARRISPVPWAAFLFKALISFFRTVPDLVWALIFVVTVGLGAVAGTMTILVDTIGFCGRFFAEAMEDADPAPQEALAAHGAPKGAILLGAVIPDALPAMTGIALFAFEKAVRSSVVLGLVGAGGIGQELKSAFDLFQYDNAATIMLAIFALVLAMEWLTDRARRALR